MTAQTGLAVTRDAANNGTTPKGMRLATGGLLAKQSTGLDVRKGILWDGGGTVVSGTAGMNYSVRACNAVVMPSSTQGPVIVPNDAALTVATTAAPGANSRIDIIWCRQHLVAADGGADADVVGQWGCTQGAAAASPTAPAIPTGAVEVARAVVTAGTVATNTLTISQTHLWTAAVGAPIPVRNDSERAALFAFDGLLVNNLTAKRLQKYDITVATWRDLDEVVDTGVTACATVGGWAGVCNARMIGKLIEVRFDLTGGSAGNNSSINNVATIPAGFPAPAGSHARGAGVAAGFAVTSYVLMGGGQIGFSNFSGATRTAIAGSVFYFTA